jgi:hypothetical protein
VASLFNYVEKCDENDGDVSCSVTATLFFCLVKQEMKFCGKNFANFHLFRKTKFGEINIKILRNTGTKGILSRNFVSRNFIDHPTTNVIVLNMLSYT